MRASVLRAFAVSVIALNATMALSQPVSDLFTPGVCSAALRGFYQKRISEIRMRDARDLLRYDWCKAEVGSEKEAREQGFDLDLMYKNLDIDLASDDRWRKAKDWVNANCGNYRSQSAETTATARYEEVMDSEVAKEQLLTFEHCVNGPDYGLVCRAGNVPGSSTRVQLYMRWRQPVDAPAPVVKTSTILGGNVPGVPAGRVFKPNTVITPGGQTATAVRTNPKSEVTFDVQLKKPRGGAGGYPNCSVTVPGGPLYTVVVTKLEVRGDRAVQKQFSGMDTVAHCNCNGIILSHLITVNTEPGYSLDVRTISYDSTPNPHITAMFAEPNQAPPEYRTCWSVLQGKATATLTPEGNAAITVQVNECPERIGRIMLDNYFRAACHWARRADCNGGGGNGTRVEVKMTGTKMEPYTKNLRVGPITGKTPRDSPVEIDLPAVEADVQNLHVSFDVLIIDKATNQSYSLSDSKPSDRGALATVDMGERKLKISLPQ